MRKAIRWCVMVVMVLVMGTTIVAQEETTDQQVPATPASNELIARWKALGASISLFGDYEVRPATLWLSRRFFFVAEAAIAKPRISIDYYENLGEEFNPVRFAPSAVAGVIPVDLVKEVDPVQRVPAYVVRSKREMRTENIILGGHGTMVAEGSTSYQNRLESTGYMMGDE